jgi:hypothetical protein
MPLPDRITSYAESTLQLTCAADTLSDIVNAFIPPSEDGKPGFDLASMFGEKWQELFTSLTQGYQTFVWPSELIPTHYVLISEPDIEPGTGELLSRLAAANGLTVKSWSKDPSVHYIAESDKLIGPSNIGVRFWRLKDGRLMVSPSQFGLSSVMKEEAKGSFRELPAGTLAYLHADFEKMTILLSGLSLMSGFTGGGIPNIGALKDHLGGAEVLVRTTEEGFSMEGSSDLPLGFVLHLLSSGYN